MLKDSQRPEGYYGTVSASLRGQGLDTEDSFFGLHEFWDE